MACQLPAPIARGAVGLVLRLGPMSRGFTPLKKPGVGHCTPRLAEPYARNAAAMPQVLVTSAPGSSRMTPTPV
jgi:hypothetical protein